MSDDFGIYGGNSLGSATANAGTVINLLVPPRKNAFSRIRTLTYTAAATAHTLTLLRPLLPAAGSFAKLAAEAAAGQAVVALDKNPSPTGNTIAANDYVVIDPGNGTFVLATVSSWSSPNLTLSANLTAPIPAGSTLWMLGVAADTDPRSGSAHPTRAGTASVTTTYTDPTVGVIGTLGRYEPILVQSNNASNAGTIQQVSYVHTKK